MVFVQETVIFGSRSRMGEGGKAVIRADDKVVSKGAISALKKMI
jgi:hypothetical protein